MGKELHVNYYVVDAFTEEAFKGNPAAVCLLKEEKPEEWLQSVATEFNLSETCYLTRLTTADDGSSNPIIPKFHLRWFTPAAEVNLCGHATLAASHVLFTNGLVESSAIEFVTLSGILISTDQNIKLMHEEPAEALWDAGDLNDEADEGHESN